MNYWLITLRGIDGEQVRVKPENVKMVKDKMNAGGVIHTPTKSIPVDQIKSFEETDQPYINETKQIEAGKLMEDAARAFNEPVIENDAVMVKWVKKSVPTRMWHKHYSHIPTYRIISDDGNHALVAFRQPIHLMNGELQECTEDEINKVTRS